MVVYNPADDDCYLFPPEELLEEVVRLRLSAAISLLTSVSRSVDILFLRKGKRTGVSCVYPKLKDFIIKIG